MPYATISRGTRRTTRTRRRRAHPSAGAWRLVRRAVLALRGAPLAVRIGVGTVLLVAVWAAANWIVQVARKPTEVFFPVSDSLMKAPAQTWRQYGPLFAEHSTAVITPELLAALAQVEGSGNPMARTYWRWRFSWNPFDVYRPASSAVGMFQITNDGSATAPADYTATSGTLTFTPSQTSKTVTVQVNGDLTNEGTETYTLNLSNAPSANLADNQGGGTIVDDDGAPTLSIDDVTVTEGHAGTVDATLTVSLSPASGQTVSVGFATADGSALRPADYASTGGNVVFAPGQTTNTVTVQVNGDLLDEINENFTVRLSGPVNATIGDSEGLITITDDDAPTTMRVNDATVTEGNAGTVNASFAVTLDAPSGRPVTVDYATTGSSANAPSDYTAVSASLLFNPGETTKPVVISVNGDLLDEGNETYVLGLTNQQHASFGDSAGLGTINDDDPMPALAIADVSATEGNDGSTDALVTVTLTPVSGRAVTVNFATTPGSATAADFQPTSGQLIFAAGETTKTITVPISGDLLDEADETFTVTLSTPDFATFTDSSAVVTIADDDALPSLGVDDVTLSEGDSGPAIATFTVSLSPVSGRPVTVHHATANGTAGAPADFVGGNGDLTFLPGETTKTVPVTVNGDLLDEIDETFALNLSGQTNATLGDGSGLGTITDDDPLPTISVNDIAIGEPDTGTSNLTFAVSLSSSSGRPVSVGFSTANGDATAPADYLATTGTVEFAPGQTARQVIVPVNGDLLDEANETFVLNLAGAVDATISDSQGIGTINDDDPLPDLDVGDANATESDAGTVELAFPVTLDAPSGRPVTVDFATANGTATAPADYTSATGTLTFLAGETTKTIVVLANGDELDEADADTFSVTLSNAGNATIDDQTAVGTIADDDALPVLTIANATVLEGDAGTVDLSFPLTLDTPSGRPVTVSYATVAGSAASPGDYAATSGALTFLPGETVKTIVVSVAGDLLDEIDETFSVNLSSPGNATLADRTGLGTITDDDGTPSVSVNDVTVTEGNGGSVNANFTVSLSTSSGQPVSVDYATVDGSAFAPADYTPLPPTTVTFTPGQTTKQLTVVVAGDALDEIDETYTLNLSNPVNASLSDAFGLGTIMDNDPFPLVSVNDVTVTEGDAGTVDAVFTVSLNAPSGRALSVDFATANGSATEPADYTAVTGTFTFLPGQTTKTLAVSVKVDLLNEVNEAFNVVLSNPQLATLGDATGVGTITDDDPQPTLVIDDVTLTEGDAGTTNATFTVTMSAVSGRNVTVNYATVFSLASHGRPPC